MSYSHDGGAPATSIEDLSRQLHGHEAHSQARYQELCDQITKQSENKMGMTDIADKVNIHVGGADGGGFGGAAAMIAALGNRNDGSDNAALIAALGNRNDGAGGMAALAPLLAGMNGNNGMNNPWPIILLALLGRGRGGGLFGGGDDCGSGGSRARTHADGVKEKGRLMSGPNNHGVELKYSTQNGMSSSISEKFGADGTGVGRGAAGPRPALWRAGADDFSVAGAGDPLSCLFRPCPPSPSICMLSPMISVTYLSISPLSVYFRVRRRPSTYTLDPFRKYSPTISARRP